MGKGKRSHGGGKEREQPERGRGLSPKEGKVAPDFGSRFGGHLCYTVVALGYQFQ